MWRQFARDCVAAMTPKEMEALADRLMGAIEAGDIETVKSCYAPGVAIWHNFDEIDQSLEDNLKVMHWMARHLLERKYTIEKRRYFEDGMLQQHVLTGITPDGTPFRMPACIVFTMRQGRIARLEEYLDTAQTAPLRAS
jgi:ketosteroid isomerase-like protein